MHSKAIVLALATLQLGGQVAEARAIPVETTHRLLRRGRVDPIEADQANVPVISADEAHKVVDLSAQDMADLADFEMKHPGGRDAKYAPLVMSDRNRCPGAPQLFRQGNWDLPKEEVEWRKKRAANTAEAYGNLIGGLFADHEIEEVHEILQKHGAPTVALAVSGGGYRSMLHGAGVLQAWQGEGKLQHLADTATYLVGVSGGAWLVASLAVNEWKSIRQLRALGREKGPGAGLWDISARAWAYRDVILNKAERLLWLPIKTKVGNQLRKLVNEKGLVQGNPGKFKLSSTDFWGRRLAMQMFYSPYGDGLPDYTWSDIATQDKFKQGLMPMPIVTSAEFGPINEATGAISLDLPVYEYSPFEWGTQSRVPSAAQGSINPDGSIPGAWWMSTKYMGTRIDLTTELGKAEQKPMYGNCVINYDNAGFIMGASSSFFNAMELRVKKLVEEAKIHGKPIVELIPRLGRFLQSFAGFMDENTKEVDLRPQSGAAPIPDPRDKEENILMVDGGMTGENLALEPLLRTEREVDIIFAIDTSNDSDVDPKKLVHSHGIALIATAEKTAALKKLGVKVPGIPTIPGRDTMTEEVNRIRFFGCDEPDKPFIVYVPNHDWEGMDPSLVKASSIETTTLEINEERRDRAIQHGFELGKGAGDAKGFSKCVGCAMLWRSAGGKAKLPGSCGSCYEKFCYSKGIQNPQPW